MDPAIFRSAPMGLRERMLDIHIDDRLSYDAATNTVFMNYAGMRVRNATDLDAIARAVDALLGPLGKRVNSIVNYEGFTVDDDVIDAYMDAVKYVEKTYYLSVALHERRIPAPQARQPSSRSGTSRRRSSTRRPTHARVETHAIEDPIGLHAHGVGNLEVHVFAAFEVEPQLVVVGASTGTPRRTPFRICTTIAAACTLSRFRLGSNANSAPCAPAIWSAIARRWRWEDANSRMRSASWKPGRSA